MSEEQTPYAKLMLNEVKLISLCPLGFAPRIQQASLAASFVQPSTSPLASMALSIDVHWRLGQSPGFIQHGPARMCIASYGQKVALMAMIPLCMVGADLRKTRLRGIPLIMGKEG